MAKKENLDYEAANVYDKKDKSDVLNENIEESEHILRRDIFTEKSKKESFLLWSNAEFSR